MPISLDNCDAYETEIINKLTPVMSFRFVRWNEAFPMLSEETWKKYNGDKSNCPGGL